MYLVVSPPFSVIQSLKLTYSDVCLCLTLTVNWKSRTPVHIYICA